MTFTGFQHCRSCDASVHWLRHPTTGKLAPIDATPSPEGDILINLTQGTYQKLSADERPAHAGWLHMNHFVTCPKAADWRFNKAETKRRKAQAEA